MKITIYYDIMHYGPSKERFGLLPKAKKTRYPEEKAVTVIF